MDRRHVGFGVAVSRCRGNPTSLDKGRAFHDNPPPDISSAALTSLVPAKVVSGEIVRRFELSVSADTPDTANFP